MEPEKSAVLLEGILDTLRLIRGDLEKQESRWAWLEEKLNAGDIGAEPGAKKPVGENESETGSICSRGRKGTGSQGAGAESERIQINRHLDAEYDTQQMPHSVKTDDEVRTADEENIVTLHQAPEKTRQIMPWDSSQAGLEAANSEVLDSASFILHSKLPVLPDDDAESVESSSEANNSDQRQPPDSRPHISACSTSNSGLGVSREQIKDSRSPSPDNSLLDLQGSNAWAIERNTRKVEWIRYRDWNSPLADSKLHAHKLLQKELGDAWTIPDDGRIPLVFSRDYLEDLTPAEINSRLPLLAAFRDRMKRDPYVDFKVIDTYSPNSSVYGEGGQYTYRLGEPVKINGKLRVPRPVVDYRLQPGRLATFTRFDIRNVNPTTPWRRFIFCQGLCYAQLRPLDFPSWLPEQPDNVAPILPGTYPSKNWHYYFSAMRSHIRCRRYILPSFTERINHYEDLTTAFHITFFEILPSYRSKEEKFKDRGSWNRLQGPLYSSLESKLCESAWTMIEVPVGANGASIRPLLRERRKEPKESWTIMVLSPPLFTARRLSTPYDINGPMHSFALMMLSHCFEQVQERWAELQEHLEMLLDERDTLLDPTEHDKLLWDDEIFSRSRKYFWAIHCLTEFQISINDNIVQWEAYRTARIIPLLEAKVLSAPDMEHLKEINDSITLMKELRSYFIEKQTSTKALRDGLFNASAVAESRASTRLGENVKLLTLVSIFFLPLAFCTSLWSINNMFSTTTLIYTITIIGVATYLIVFNLNNLVHQASKSYQGLRNTLIKQMKEDKSKSSFWMDRGERFDVFRPQHQKVNPSEWWILIFVLKTVLQEVLRFLHFQKPRRGNKDDSSETPTTTTSSSSSRTSRLSMDGGSVFSSEISTTTIQMSEHQSEAVEAAQDLETLLQEPDITNDPSTGLNERHMKLQEEWQALQAECEKERLSSLYNTTTTDPEPTVENNGKHITITSPEGKERTTRNSAKSVLSKFLHRNEKTRLDTVPV